MGLEFSSVTATYYYKTRTTYCPQLFADIKNRLNLDSTSRILDIGAGTGQASWPFVQAGCQAVLVEPSKKFNIFLEHNYHDMKSVRIINQSYEDIYFESIYDMVMAGTSFHWLDPKIKYKKAYDMLKDDGHLVLFWSRPDLMNCPVWKDIMVIKEKYNSSDVVKKQEESLVNAFLLQRAEIRNSNIFKCNYSKIYKYDKEYSDTEMCNLFDTFVDIMALPLKEKSEFQNEVKNYLSKYSKSFQLTYYVDLYICEKIALS